MKIYRDYVPRERKVFENDLIKRKESVFDEHISKGVKNILRDIKNSGDSAIVKYSKIFDKVELKPSGFKVTEKEYKEAFKNVSSDFLEAIKLARKNISMFHKRQIQDPIRLNNDGISLALNIKPIENVGVYVPGGKFSYPSTLLMCVVPAKIAGVARVVVCSPVKTDGKISPYLLVAAKLCEVDEFYKISGVAAIGALAYGTKTIKRVDKIVGPGNVYVTEAKRQVFGMVGIDSLAGPSEIMIIADDTANPEFISYDLLAQAEHDKNALSVLITTSNKLASNVGKNILATENIIIVLVKNINRAIEIVNEYGPEHLEIVVNEGDCPSFLKKKGTVPDCINNAGSILIGNYSPASFTDYTVGVNHVLPTRGGAKFSSVLSVADFMKKVSVVKMSRQGLMNISRQTSLLAGIEGFEYHKRSISVRVCSE